MVQTQPTGKTDPFPVEKIPMPLRVQNNQPQCLDKGNWRLLTNLELRALEPDDLKALQELKDGEELTIQY